MLHQYKKYIQTTVLGEVNVNIPNVPDPNSSFSYYYTTQRHIVGTLYYRSVSKVAVLVVAGDLVTF